MDKVNPTDFIIQYPGVYEGEAKEAMDKYFARIEEINSMEVTGEDVAAGRVKEPKMGAIFEVKEDMMLYCANKYAPDYAPLVDAESAKKHGYKDIIAMLAFAANDDIYTTPTPPEARDTLLVSQICHDISTFNPVYPGDTIYMVRDKIEVTDLTPPEGSIYRHLQQKNYGTTYNQDGVIINKVCFSLMESVKLYKKGCMPKPKAEMGFADMWEDPDWLARSEHYYTDEDYEKIKSIWAAEKCQGDEPLYWEDVEIGDKQPPTAYGPIFEGLVPTIPYGMGLGGCRNLKKEIMDPETFKTLIRDEKTGIYRSADETVNVPPLPEGVEVAWPMPQDDDEESSGEINTADIHKNKDTRSVLINFMGRDIVIGHLLNNIGYDGTIYRIRWSIMCPETHAALGKPVPETQGYQVFTRQVSGMEKSIIPVHGLSNDMAIVKSVVVDKYVRNQKTYAKVAFWIEEIEGQIWLTGEAELDLPSRMREE